MTGHYVVSIGAAALLSVASATALDEPAALSAFSRHVASYVELHRQVERMLPPLDVKTDVVTLYDTIEQMGHAMVLSRANARQGDIFAPEIARVLRVRIRKALQENQYELADLMAYLREEAEWEPVAPPAVNSRFPWHIGSGMPPCLFKVLPPLPPELEYRLLGPHLILVDLHADMIVDLIPGVLDET